MNGLRDQEDVTGWCRPNGFDLLTGKKYARYRGLGKIRFRTTDAQHRPLGFFGPDRREFTLVIWATERDGAFDPPNVLETALERMKLVRARPELAIAFDL